MSTSVAFSRNDAFLASGSDDDTVILWQWSARRIPGCITARWIGIPTMCGTLPLIWGYRAAERECGQNHRCLGWTNGCLQVITDGTYRCR